MCLGETLDLQKAAEIHLDWLKTRPEDYGEDVRKMLIQGTEVPAVNYINALKNIKEIRNEFLKILKRVDVIIIPTTALTAPLFDESIASNTKPLYPNLPASMAKF